MKKGFVFKIAVLVTVTILAIAIITVCPDDMCSDISLLAFGLSPKEKPPETCTVGRLANVSIGWNDARLPTPHVLALDCHRKSNRVYFDVGRNACLSLPDGSATYFSPNTYFPPPDPTLVPLVDMFGASAALATNGKENEPHEGPLLLSPSAHNVSIRHVPSIHSRWLFEDWRLWEGELPCTNREEILALKTPPTGIFSSQPDGRPPFGLRLNGNSSTSAATVFESKGGHRGYLPNNLYELENVCIDEETGSLLEFVSQDKYRLNNIINETNATNKTSATTSTAIEPFEGMIEHPFSFPISGAHRFFHPNNRETVRILVPPTPAVRSVNASTETATDEWHRTVIDSLRAHHHDTTCMSQSTTANCTSGGMMSSPQATSVMFVDDPALMVILTAFDSYNPGHVFQRIAVASSLSRMLGTRSLIYLTEFVALDEGQEYVSTYALNQAILGELSNFTRKYKGQVQVNLTDLLPVYLQPPRLPNQAKSVKRARPRSKRRPSALSNAELQYKGHNRPHVVAKAFASGKIAREHTIGSLTHPLSMSGERGCERMRCAGSLAPSALNDATTSGGEILEGSKYKPSCFSDVRPALADGRVPQERHCDISEVAAIRRCGRRYVSINIALEKKLKQWRAGDTQNYSADVWSNAVRETLREGRRLRKDVWAAKHAVRAQIEESGVVPPLPMPLSAPPFLISADTGDKMPHAVRRLYRDQYKWYMALWRRRLVYLSSVRGATLPNASHLQVRSTSQAPMPMLLDVSVVQDERILDEYLYEFMAYRLEYEALRSEGHKKSRTRQLMCYRSIYISHNHHKRPSRSVQRGSLSIAKAPTVHDAEALKNAYEATVARFGVCSASDVASASSSTSEEDIAQANNTHRHAHPLFTLPLGERTRLNRALGRSRASVEGVLHEVVLSLGSSSTSSSSSSVLHRALLSDSPLVGLKDAVPEVASLIDRIESGQREYDELLMRRFRRGESGARPIAALHVARFASRQIHHSSALFTSMSSEKDGNDTMSDFIDFAVHEGLHPERQNPYEARSSRSAQYNAFLTSDILFGAHGADMHGSAYLKPSALMLELGVGGLDWHTRDFNAGFFSQLAIARNIGYLRINMDTFGSYPSQSAFMSLPEWRHALSTAVCSWLAFNAVRLSDEARANIVKINSTAEATTPRALLEGEDTDFSYLVPWWCRGGALEVLESHRASLRKLAVAANMSFSREFPDAPDPSRASSFIARRSERRFGFAVPMCPPLVPSLVCPLRAQTSQSSGMCQIVTTVEQSALDRLQNECARRVTASSKTENTDVDLRRVQALQTFFELSFMMGERSAAGAAMLVVNGKRGALGGDNMTLLPDALHGYDEACGYSHKHSDEQCIRRLVDAVYGLSSGNRTPALLVSPCFVSELNRILNNRVEGSSAMRLPRATRPKRTLRVKNNATNPPCGALNFTISAALASNYSFSSYTFSHYVFTEMMRMTANASKRSPHATDSTSRFTYGWAIDDPLEEKKGKQKIGKK